MFSVVMIAFCGVVAGYGLRRWKALQHVNQTITLTICFMLFVLGLSVGQNRMVVTHLGSYGVQALIISLAAMLGSAVGGWLLYRYVFKEKEEKGMEKEIILNEKEEKENEKGEDLIEKKEALKEKEGKR